MNTAWEIHDSELISVKQNEKNLVIQISPAIIHKSAGIPGRDSGTVSVGKLQIIISEVLNISGADIKGELATGHLRAEGQLFDNVIPILMPIKKRVEMSLSFNNIEDTFVVTGNGFEIEIISDGPSIGKFPGTLT